ncbi:MAG: MoaD/ThiS family protein [Thaumarchaeota archaeon]|nr:MoaD/ThiS family protein [Nitrososphaerota archaeon]
MRVTVKAFATLREAFGGRGVLHLDLPDGSTIRDLLKALRSYGPVDELIEERSNVKILVNGREITYLDGLETRLKDGDAVAFIPPVAGG